jgi:hypothetical protein
MGLTEPYLEVTFRRGRPLAAYYYLPRRAGDRAVRTERRPAGLMIDFARGGRAIGIEITTPSRVSLTTMNRVLRSVGQPPMSRSELAPVLAA